MESHVFDSLPTFSQLARFAPIAIVVCGLVYFGWWLRGDTVKALREFIEYLKSID